MTVHRASSDNEQELGDEFSRLAERLEIGPRAPTLWTELRDRYSESHRAYHSLSHIAECLVHFEASKALARDADLVEIALWAHDAIYDPRRSDNEQRSAEWVRDALLNAGLSGEQSTRAHALVLATTHESIPADADAQLLCDIDLAVLGAPRVRFDEYETQIRAEYAWVPEEVFRTRRAELLGRFLARPSLYSTAPFREAFERTARANLQRSLAALAGGRTPG